MISYLKAVHANIHTYTNVCMHVCVLSKTNSPKSFKLSRSGLIMYIRHKLAPLQMQAWKHGLVMLDWCCMCKRAEETIDHLLHCPMAQELWDLVFSMFGIAWVMPQGVVELLACLSGAVLLSAV